MGGVVPIFSVLLATELPQHMLMIQENLEVWRARRELTTNFRLITEITD